MLVIQIEQTVDGRIRAEAQKAVLLVGAVVLGLELAVVAQDGSDVGGCGTGASVDLDGLRAALRGYAGDAGGGGCGRGDDVVNGVGWSLSVTDMGSTQKYSRIGGSDA